MNNITLNNGQREADNAFLEFLLTDSSQKEFIISGPAGTGKTALMSHIIDNTMMAYQNSCQLLGMKPEYTEVDMTATTNKAAEVLGRSVKRPTSTIHSLLNLRVSEDYETGKTLLARTREWRVHNNKIIFIDEASMIDSDLYKILHEGTNNCKIVFVGDHCQLAPIYETLSPIYRQNSPFYELTEQMRNNNQPALMDVCSQLRETVETGVFKPIHLVNGVIDLLDDTRMQFELVKEFVPGPNLNSRILAYTNKQVVLYNEYIRQERGLPELYTIGEILVSNTMSKLANNQQLSVEQELTIIDNQGTTKISITKDAELEVQLLTVDTEWGDRHQVKVPVDRDHWDKLCKYYARNKNWERYFHLKQMYADLRPRDAATVHKSQGSTYDSVFIDLENISKVNQPDIAARMLYVAFSRAKNRVYLYGSLAEKYGGLRS